VPETAEARSIRFDVPEDLRETSVQAGPASHPQDRDRRRGDPTQLFAVRRTPGREIKVTVKRIAGGIFSNWANDNLKPGDASR
jgi:ring-1,2-phenylacetyl-CoA epoxidase subunit PaaE